MSISDEFSRCKSGCATLGDVLCDLGSDHFCMERERTAREHFHSSRNGAIKVCGCHNASRDTVGSWAGGCTRGIYRIRRVQPRCAGDVLKSGVW